MAVTRNLEEVEREIAETKAALMDVHGTETEVYARIVGYYRAVKHWNKGKRDEFDQRKLFTLQDSNLSEKSNEIATKSESSATPSIEEVSNKATELSSITFEMFTKQTCPNCPPVKAFMSNLEMPGRSIDVDTETGLAEAAKKGVFASPTVIFYNEAGIETARCHNVEELEAVCSKIKVTA